MAKLVDFEGRNKVFVAEGCGDLPAMTGDGYIATCWELSDEELARILQTKRLFLLVWADGVPPVSIQAASPIAGEG